MAYSATLFRGPTLLTVVVVGGGGDASLSTWVRGGTTLPLLFRGTTMPTGVEGGGYSVYWGEGGLLFPPISVAYSVYWGAGGRLRG